MSLFCSFLIFSISFEGLVTTNVWEFMCKALRSQLNIPPTEKWEKGIDCLSYFQDTSQALFLILFLDEMDTVLYSPYKEEFLSTFRNLKANSARHGLKVIFCFKGNIDS
jgi:hypothetical protein